VLLKIFSNKYRKRILQNIPAGNLKVLQNVQYCTVKRGDKKRPFISELQDVFSIVLCSTLKGKCST
jgi:hypothetical protein